MVLMQFQIHSKILQMETDVWALVPGMKPASRRPNGQNQEWTAPEENREETWKVLWLLHGGVGDHTFWLRHTAIESIAESYGNLAVILPDAYGSSCVDTVSGARFGTYLSQDFPINGKTIGSVAFPMVGMEVCIWDSRFPKAMALWAPLGPETRQMQISRILKQKRNDYLEKEICTVPPIASAGWRRSWEDLTGRSPSYVMAVDPKTPGGI